MSSTSPSPPTALRSIEAEIGQTKPFASEKHRAMVNLMFTYGWFMERSRSILDSYGITVQQYNVLRILRGAGEAISTSVIRSRMLDRMSDTSRLVDRLEKKGLVVRNTCPSDKRLVDVQLNDAGKKLLKTIDAKENDFALLADGLDDGEAKQLNTLLDRLRSSSSS